jgi:hypothetical protein
MAWGTASRLTFDPWAARSALRSAASPLASFSVENQYCFRRPSTYPSTRHSFPLKGVSDPYFEPRWSYSRHTVNVIGPPVAAEFNSSPDTVFGLLPFLLRPRGPSLRVCHFEYDERCSLTLSGGLTDYLIRLNEFLVYCF